LNHTSVRLCSSTGNTTQKTVSCNMSKVSKSSGAADTQGSSLLLLEAQKHLPTPDAVGTFALRKRLSTPSGRPVAPTRPSSAIASRSRGVSVGAEESRPADEVRVEKTGITTPTISMIRDVESWVRDAQHQLKKTSAAPPTLGGDPRDAVTAATQRTLRQQWRSRLLQDSKHRSCYPSVVVGVEDVAQRGVMDRLCTLLHAVGQYKVLVDAGKVPSLTLPSPSSGKPITLTANTSSFLFGSTVTTASTQGSSPTVGDVVCGADHSARHAALIVGTHMYQLDLFHPDGTLLAAVEIRERVLAAVTHSTSSPHPHDFLGVLSAASSSDKKSWADVVSLLNSTCLANRQSLRLLDTALFVVTLAPEGTSEDASSLISGAIPSTASWSGSALQMIMYPSGTCVLRANSMFVDATTLCLFARWTSNAANTDPMLKPPQEPASPTATQALRRLPLCLVRPSTAGAKPMKGAPATSSAAAASAAVDNFEANIEETASIVEVAIPKAPRATLLRPLPLWLSVVHSQKLSALDLRPAVSLLTFVLPQAAARIKGALELASIVAVDRTLRVDGDELPPLVRYSRASSTSCPDETTIFSDTILNAVNMMKSLRVADRLGNLQRAQLRRTIAAGMESVASLQWAADGPAQLGGEAQRIAPSQYLPVARSLSKGGYFPNAPTLRRGEACAAADVLIFAPAAADASQLGLSFAVERGSCGADSARFSLSLNSSQDESGATHASAILFFRRDDERAAAAFVGSLRHTLDQMTTLCGQQQQ
jgi:hypothetical protein